MQAHRRHDISDKIWKLLTPAFQESKEVLDVRQRITGFINALFFGFYAQALPGGETFLLTIMVTEKILRDVFAVGVIEVFGWRLLDVLIDYLDYEWLMIDASHIKVHPLMQQDPMVETRT